MIFNIFEHPKKLEYEDKRVTFDLRYGDDNAMVRLVVVDPTGDEITTILSIGEDGINRRDSSLKLQALGFAMDDELKIKDIP